MNQTVLIVLFAIFLSIPGLAQMNSGRPAASTTSSSEEIGLESEKNDVDSMALIAKPNDKATIDVKIDVTKYQLENGLTVLLHRDNSVPMVTHHLWYKIGSRYERPGVTGMSHMLEHMMFKGSKKYSRDEFEKLLHEAGVRNNAFATFDYTGYYHDLPPHMLELIMDIEADRMVNLQFQEEDLLTEREVVAEERRFRVDNNPRGLVQEVSFGSVFKVHPYRWPVIGYMNDIQKFKIEDARYFYETYYAPNNAVLVIAGDIDIDATKKLIQKYYGPLEAKQIPELKVPAEPTQKGERNVQLKKSIQSPILTLAYKSVPAGHEDMYALDLIANLLGEGPSSRLYQQMVYKSQSSTSVGSYNYTPADAGVFVVSANLKPGQSIDKVKNEALRVIFDLRRNKVSEKELQKAKNQVMKAYVDNLTTLSGKARSLAANEILLGDYTAMFKDLEQYQKITPEQIMETAERYLHPNHRSVISLLPRK